MEKRKVLYVVHNHPSVRPGGAEGYALELYEAMKASGAFEPILLAKGGPPVSAMRRPHEGTLLSAVNGDPNQYFFFTDDASYDWLYGTSRDKEVYTRFFRSFLEAYRPDVVHFQHTLFFGYDILREVRNTLPDVPILYTLHEFLPICHRNGQMVRPRSDELCHSASPRRCHACFPDVSPQTFFMRKRFVQSHFALVDRFLAPSRFLLERYVAWGIPREKIVFEEYGRRDFPAWDDPPTDRPRTHLGFFGQFSHFKGVEVLLRAMKLLAEERRRDHSMAFAPAAAFPPEPADAADAAGHDVHLWLHGANLELQPGTFQNTFRELVAATRDAVTLVGRYEQDEMAKLMKNVDWVVIPSIWWENSPLVIQEAFGHGKPVICSNIGGMAEKVTDGVDGLHFRAGDPISLARTIRRAVRTPGLWETLRGGIAPVYRIEDSVRTLTDLYDTLLTNHAAS